MLPSGSCSAVTRHGVKERASIFSRLLSPEMSCCGIRSSIYIDAELEPIETVNWFPRAIRKDYVVGLNLTAAAVDDPDQQFFENYACGAERNITGYCNPELEKQFERQSMEPDREKRKKLVWEIDRKLQEDGARPIIFHYRAASLPAALRQRADDHGQQHLQRLALRRRLARPLAQIGAVIARRALRDKAISIDRSAARDRFPAGQARGSQ